MFMKIQLLYEYYFFDYCKLKKVENMVENFGEVFCGDCIENFFYVVSFGVLLF